MGYKKGPVITPTFFRRYGICETKFAAAVDKTGEQVQRVQSHHMQRGYRIIDRRSLIKNFSAPLLI